MATIEVILGETFGKWTVIEEIERNQYRERRVKCQCQCGTIRDVVFATLHKGSSKSCGCMAIGKKPAEIAPGEKFHHLTVIKEVARANGRRCMRCQCECGNVKDILLQNLRGGATKSCGCMSKIREQTEIVPGEKFYHWTILEEIGKIKKHRYVKCQCQCGNVRELSFYNLRSGDVKSCGCMRERKLNLTPGTKIHHLTVIKMIRRDPGEPLLFQCQCVCGKVKNINYIYLRSGTVKSCGCRGQVLNAGDQFHHWTVLEEARKDLKGPRYVKCRCQCGKIKEVLFYSLRTGSSKSCGCKMPGRKKMEIVPGEKFNHWTVLEELKPRVNGTRRIRCQCRCRRVRILPLYKLHMERSKSCGCGQSVAKVKLAPRTKIHHWTILQESGYDSLGYQLFQCECVCGKQKNVRATYLRSGVIKSCGCRGLVAKVGDQFHHWTVLEEATRDSEGLRYVKCQCRCGNVKKVLLDELCKGKSKSCGCRKRKTSSRRRIHQKKG